MPVDDVKRLGRSTQGVIVMRLREGEIVSTLAPVSSPATRAPTTPSRDAGRRRGPHDSQFSGSAFPFAKRAVISCKRGVGDRREGRSMAYSKQVDLLEPIDWPSISTRSSSTSAGVPDRRHLEDAARLLDEQGADPDEGQEAADLRHGRVETGDADQAGEGQGP
jgi:hypothetical protein